MTANCHVFQDERHRMVQVPLHPSDLTSFVAATGASVGHPVSLDLTYDTLSVFDDSFAQAHKLLLSKGGGTCNHPHMAHLEYPIFPFQ